VLHSLDQAPDRLKTRYANRDFELVGYSGGATLALLLGGAATTDAAARLAGAAGLRALKALGRRALGSV
jgi:predicted alpha/beta-fold hydrolase